MKNIKLYCAGGAGINIGSYFSNQTVKDNLAVSNAEIIPTYIDTSRSNLAKSIPEESVYMIEGLDGSGKVRSENYKHITDCVLDILQSHPPGDLNIVLSSGSGGSGSVIAPVLIGELTQLGVPVVVIVVGSTDSRIELENTIRTLKSYESIAQLRKTPIAGMYFQNSSKSPRKSVDADIHRAINVLSVLFSGNIDELDSSDLRNWLNYTKVTSFEPHFCNLEFFSDKVNLEKSHHAISVATLCEPGGDSNTGTTVEYQCVGLISSKPDFKLPLHVVILTGAIDLVHKNLSESLKVIDQARQARMVKNTVLSNDDKPTHNGLIL